MSYLIRGSIMLCICCCTILSVKAQQEQRQLPTNAATLIPPILPGGSPKIPIGQEFFRFNSGSISLSYSSQYAYGPETPISANHSNASMGLTIMGVPFRAGYNAALAPWSNFNDFSYTSLRYDKDGYLSKLHEKIRSIKDPEQFLGNALNDLYARRDEAIGKLRSDVTSRLGRFAHADVEDILNKLNADNLNLMEPEQLLVRALQEQTAKLAEKQLQLNLLRDATPSQFVADSISALNKEIREISQFSESLEKASTELRTSWQQEGITQRIRGFERDKQTLITQLLQMPEVIAKIAKSKFKLGGLQRFLLNAKSLNLGGGAVSQSPLTMYNSLVKGASLEYVTNGKLLAPLLGRQPGIQNLNDLGYANHRELADIMTTALRFGKGDGTRDFTHFSIQMFQQANNGQFLNPGSPAFSGALPRNLVTSVSRKISFGAHSLLTEISKSTTIYRGANVGGPSGSLKELAGAGSFLDNMGVNIDYTGEYPGIAMQHKLAVRYTGKEYSNMGNAFLVGGFKEISNDLRKQFFNRKLQLSLRGQYREYDFSIDNRKWQMFSFMTDVKMKFRKGEFVELRYQPYFNRRTGIQSYTSNRSDRLSLRTNINRRITRGVTYRNFIDLSFINDEHYNVFTDKFGANRTFALTSLQTVDVGARSYFINLNMNRARNQSDFLFLNSSVSLDAGASFLLKRTVSLSTSVVYSEIDQLYRQLAVRQSVSAQISGKLTVNGYINAGKYFEVNPSFTIPAITGDISIQYNFK